MVQVVEMSCDASVGANLITTDVGDGMNGK